MKQKWQTILLAAVVFLCATSLAFAEGDKVRQQKQKRYGTSSYLMNLDNEMMLSAAQKRTRTRSKDGSCQTSSISPDGNMMLAANGNGNGGSSDNGGNGPGDGTGNGGVGPGDGSGNGPGEAGHGAGPGTGDCKA